MIDVCLAGTGGMLPLPDRWLTCFWLEYNGKAALIDCGEGTQISLAAHGRKLSRLNMLLITHTHADHISGLPGLLLSLGNYGKTSPLKIYGPEGIREVIASLCCICPVLPFPIEVTALSAAEMSRFLWNDMTIEALPLRHGIHCLGYAFTLRRKPVFNPQKAKALGIDVKLWSTLHTGQSITVSGTEITPGMVTDGMRAPLRITYMTDSLYFDGMVDFAADSDLLVCEGMYGDDAYLPKMQEKGHMVFSQSAALAARANVKRLWLTHYSPALIAPMDYREQVQAIFPDTVISRDGETMVLK